MPIKDKLKSAKDKVTRTVGKGISNVINYEKNRKTKAVGRAVDRHISRTADAKKTMAKHKRATTSFGGSGKPEDWSPLSAKAGYARDTINKSTETLKSDVDKINGPEKKKTLKKMSKRTPSRRKTLKKIEKKEDVTYDRSGTGTRGGGRRGRRERSR